ncbi:HNH endonuclease [Enterobacter hormaechei]|uniref:HNH endonuclease n=1 Tax=Enterobacter hormaechei TaxID=158836 RepID=UPI00294099B0|nr:HNH endonuclease [Enterobacter hormaechei]HED1260374.1 HNH endonuclease [Enterobacter hormaechei subsp. hoffmannii]MDV5486526.1 HNH endonuclease [Enterobacter hormaechei]MDV5520363.1 HNH endonuclease [Enterobacter hormaechei]MDV5521872.1 HNH endonuclease [Enterobacter hormaechei]MDV5535932.1 HNH endonuclease [Enterobacter hormaechei]
MDFFYKNYRRPVGTVAGYINSLGYVQIGIDCVAYGAHRLAWMYVHGNLPEMDVDHINGNPSDNRIENLRLATHQQNMCNRKKRIDNTSGYPGVYFNKAANKWRACIRVEGKRIHLGYFKTAQEAHDKYVEASKNYHSQYTRAQP